MKRKQSDHLLHVQALRGYCAITVALGHLFGMAGGMKSNLLTHHNVLDIALAPTRRGAECVMLFMFLSGYSLYRSKKLERWDNESSINKYFKRRFWRIYPTYIIAVLISYTIIYLARNLCMAPEKSLNNFTPIDFPGFLSHLFFYIVFQGVGSFKPTRHFGRWLRKFKHMQSYPFYFQAKIRDSSS